MLTPSAFMEQFDTVERSALRLESRPSTDIEEERSELQAFLAGELPEAREWTPDAWTTMVTLRTSSGAVFRRVRVMDQPLTDYNRYMIYCGRRSVSIGEDVRYLPRTEANALDLPDHDFWVFDSTRLVELRFTADNRPLGHDLISDPVVAARHEDWIHRASAVATPWADYVAEDPTRAWPPVRVGAVKGS